MEPHASIAKLASDLTALVDQLEQDCKTGGAIRKGFVAQLGELLERAELMGRALAASA